MEDRRPAIVAVIISFLVMSGTSMVVRLYVRKFVVKRLGWDDSKFVSLPASHVPRGFQAYLHPHQSSVQLL